MALTPDVELRIVSPSSSSRPPSPLPEIPEGATEPTSRTPTTQMEADSRGGSVQRGCEYIHRNAILLLLAALSWLWVHCGKQPVRSWPSSFIVPMALMSRLTQSIHLCFSLPRFILPMVVLSPESFFRRNLGLAFYVSKPPQSCFPAPLCDVLYFKSLPDVIVSHIVF